MSDQTLILIDKKQETHDTYSFYFSLKNPISLNFKPGQFALLQISIDKQLYSRAYSISSIPDGSHTLQITVKRVNNGVVSNWLIDHLQINETINLIGIEGEFNIIDCHAKNKILFISAGCGITPVMSMTRYLLAHEQKDIHFLHCAKDEHNVIFRKELQHIETHYPLLKTSLLLEQTPDTHALSGLISAEYLMKLCPDYHERTLFLCGPTGFMQAVKNILLQHNFDMSGFYQESFTPQAPETVDIPMNNDDTVTINLPEFSLKQDVKKGSVLLPLLEDAGLPIFAACRMGVCGSCRCKITQGDVESSSTTSLTEQEIADGYRLACSCKVMSDVTISLK